VPTFVQRIPALVLLSHLPVTPLTRTDRCRVPEYTGSDLHRASGAGQPQVRELAADLKTIYRATTAENGLAGSGRVPPQISPALEKTGRSFPTQEAAIKPSYLALKEVSKNWEFVQG
jgi:hypothetical protein